MKVTMWGSQANVEVKVNDVLSLSKAKISPYDGVSLSCTGQTQATVNDATENTVALKRLLEDPDAPPAKRCEPEQVDLEAAKTSSWAKVTGAISGVTLLDARPTFSITIKDDKTSITARGSFFIHSL